MIFPFDETSPMGWGFDFVWPWLAEAKGRMIGVIDSTPVDHSMRKQGEAYDRIGQGNAMEQYLSKFPGIIRGTFTVTKLFR